MGLPTCTTGGETVCLAVTTFDPPFARGGGGGGGGGIGCCDLLPAETEGNERL